MGPFPWERGAPVGRCSTMPAVSSSIPVRSAGRVSAVELRYLQVAQSRQAVCSAASSRALALRVGSHPEAKEPSLPEGLHCTS